MNLVSPFIAVVIGRRATGKTTLVHDILRTCNCDDYVLVAPPMGCDDVIDRHLCMGEKTLVIDGCFMSPSQWKSKPFCFAIQNEHPLIITTSYLPDVPARLLDNANYVFVFKTQSQRERAKFYKEYVAMHHEYLTQEAFDTMMESLEPFQCILFNARDKSCSVYKVQM